MKRMRPLRVLVLKGGWSAERPVSLKSGEAVEKALSEAGYRTSSLDPADPGFVSTMIKKRRAIDVVFNALHGAGGEDGRIQGFLEVLELPYTGSGVMASAICMNKNVAKELFTVHGIPTPRYQIAVQGQPVKVDMKGPVVVKPCEGGSTIGVTVVRQEKALAAALRLAWRYDAEALIEEYIPGQELTVSVLNGQALPVMEIVPANDFYDFEAKYTPGMSQHLIPPLVSTRIQVEAQRMAVRAHRALRCAGATRTDFRVHGKTKGLFAMEVNTSPGCTATSLLPEAARAAGVSFPQLVGQLVEEAMDRGRGRLSVGRKRS